MSARSSAIDFGRARPSGHTEIIADPDHRTQDQKLDALIAEHNAVEKFKAEIAAKYPKHRSAAGSTPPQKAPPTEKVPPK